MNKSKKIAWYGALIALAFLFSYIESMIPLPFGIPGMKIGLANIVVLIALYTLTSKDAFIISMVRIVLVGFTFGNLYGIIYSGAGGILSFLMMFILKKMNKYSTVGVSIIGAVFHNVGQIIVAIFIVSTFEIVYYLPVLIISGIVTGMVVGIIGNEMLKRILKL